MRELDDRPLPLNISQEEITTERIKNLRKQYIDEGYKRWPNHFSANKRMHLQALTKEEIESVGLPKEIFWKMVEFNVSAKGGLSFERIAAISERIDFLASEYCTYRERIARDFSGEEEIKQIEKLEDIWSRGLERLINAYTETVGDFFERNGAVGEKEYMRHSILVIYQQKVDQYKEFLEQNPDYAQLKGSQDAWLERDSYFMGDLLRLLFSGVKMQAQLTNSGDGYQVIDLAAAGAFYQSAKKWLINQKSTAVSEEQLGVELGFLAMKLVVLLQTEELSASLKEKLKGVYDSFVDYKIEDLNKRQEEAKHDPYSIQAHSYSKLDAESVHYWLRQMRTSIQQGNVEKIFLEIIPLAYEEFQKKTVEKSELERYQQPNDWDDFFSDAEHITYPAGKPDDFHYNTMMIDWNIFIEKIANQSSFMVMNDKRL
ncbi:hypothetical protein [Rummeliibacillus stabekisii]|uniref:Uncharacterized protein n=1 Tax=Rummeliibacillus stabekisii TaxID=241244 RepID=A0A143HHH5_9BACL|nr:hypothetical protein [Rummeliibacillus stabekisii]AMX00712.1 hypothetical protein ATY39_15680 [Rummeliibacillus stabekisii]